MRLEITIEGTGELLSSFAQVERGLVDLRQLGTWDAVQAEFYKVEKEQFASEGSAGRSGKWKELTPKYAERKTRKWGPQPILQASTKLFRSMTSETSDSQVEKQPLEMAIGTRLPYAGYHQTGGKRLPKREIISFTDEQSKRIVKPIETKIRQLVANAKLRDVRGF
jgi:phage gpG-like protein